MDYIGRYRIVSELGRGAMGVVYHAIDPTIGRSVAIKTIHIRDIDDPAGQDRLRERLFREARSAGVLSHPNIVTIYDMDEADGIAYIAMAYVNGPTLEKILASEQPLSGANMLRVLRQTALALDYAHSRGIIHRDVKPANIMTDEDGVVKVTDFGIAKVTSGIHSTRTKTITGTVNYMSPEQVQGREIDGRSDQFSLAVIAYEILTGERPFTGEHLSTVIFRIVGEEPKSAHQINGTLTPQIDEVLRKALSKRPEDRFVNCSTFVGALEMACAESRGWKTVAAGNTGLQSPGSETPEAEVPVVAALQPAPLADAAQNRRGSARPAWRLAPVLSGVAAVLAAMAFFAWRAGEFSSGSAVLPTAPSPAAESPQTPEKPPESPPSPTRNETAPSTAQAAGSIEAKADPVSAAAAPPATPEDPSIPVPAPAAVKVSPIPPATIQNEPEITIRASVRIPPAVAHGVWITSNPPGAKAVLDGNASQGCATPCMLEATPGLHHLTIAQAGFLPEYRDIHVGEGPEEIPTITLRQPVGTLMVTTNPPGASIFINGQFVPQMTPAQISLPPGTYNVRVEMAGRSQSETVQLHESPLYLKLPLNP